MTFNATERTVVLFLLGSIRVSPEKASQLIAVVDKPGRSEEFAAYLQRLKDGIAAKNVLAVADTIREELR